MPERAVSIETSDGIAVVTVRNPPVNAVSQAVREGLLDAAAKIGTLPGVSAVVLRGDDGRFIAGADIREFGHTSADPQLPDVVAAIEQSPLPWVAAIDGDALGGGLELALACRSRVASRGARLGFPEVNLGLIPGAGGTVRLPRLVPLDKAIELITSGRPIDAPTALQIGLIDRLATVDLLTEARALAMELTQQVHAPFPLASRDPVASARQIEWDALRAQLVSRWRGQASPLEALEALKDSARLPASEALAAERARFLRLRASPEAAALQHVFFAERDAASPLRDVAAEPADLSLCGVVGGGTMGAGIATALLLAGSAVRLVEQTHEAAEQGRARIASHLEASRKRGALTQDAWVAALARLMTTTDYESLSPCDLTIEAVFEDMAVKRQVFAALDRAVSADAVLATNTSYLDVAALAAETARPERVIGLHFFSPAHLMKLLEVIRTPSTGARALATARALARLLGKVPVVAGVCDGFIGNRIMAAYREECEAMLLEGALPETVDSAMRGFGFAMGIFETQDMSGLDIAWAMRRRRAAEGKTAARPSHIADRLCEIGRLGRKTDAGWYRYEAGSSKPIRDPAVAEIIRIASDDLGLSRRDIPADEIVRRILSRMQAEGRSLLAEGIARNAADIDVTMTVGYGFPRFRGGPMHLAGRSEAVG